MLVMLVACLPRYANVLLSSVAHDGSNASSIKPLHRSTNQFSFSRFSSLFSLRSAFIIRVVKSLAMYIYSRISRLDILRPLAIIDFPAFRLPSSFPPSIPSRQGDNTAKIISVTRHATCRCNFATISNFLGSLAFSPFLLPRRFPFAEGKGRGDGNRDRITGSKARKKERGEPSE